VNGTQGLGLDIALLGFGVVFLALAVVTGTVSLVRRVDERWQAAEQRRVEAAPTRTPTIDDTTMVVLAAAVATVLGGRHRIRSIRRILSPRDHHTSSTWTHQGRAVLLGSHSVPRRSGSGGHESHRGKGER
jgi:Na+-transporting methylmalonyl-CoA/oxaloacetate decarboxylase gamma subunit